MRERFDGLANSIETERRTLPWTAGSPEEFIGPDGGPFADAGGGQGRDAAPIGYAEMREDMVDVARGWAGGDGPFSVDAEYLLMVARRHGSPAAAAARV